MKFQAMAMTLCSTVGLLAGCAMGTVPLAPLSMADPAAPPSPGHLGGLDAYLLPGAELVAEESLVMGGHPHWTGRLVLASSHSVDQTLTAYEQVFLTQGWQLISSVRGQSSLLVFTRADMAATVSVVPGSWRSKTRLMITVTPSGTAAKAVAAPR